MVASISVTNISNPNINPNTTTFRIISDTWLNTSVTSHTSNFSASSSNSNSTVASIISSSMATFSKMAGIVGVTKWAGDEEMQPNAGIGAASAAGMGLQLDEISSYLVKY